MFTVVLLGARFQRSFGGLIVSLVFHMALVIVLGLWTFSDLQEAEVEISTASFVTPQKLVTEVLDELTAADLSSFEDMQSSLALTPDLESSLPDPQSIANLDALADEPDVFVADVEFVDSGSQHIAQDYSQDVLGQAVATAAGAGQAVDRITEELSQLLWQRKVLVIWCFDQSGSMKADRELIRGRVNKIYGELIRRGDMQGDDLTTSVVSFGEASKLHTLKPTYALPVILKAIDEVPVDLSGKEVMLKAIVDSITHHQQFLSYNLAGAALVDGADPPDGQPVTFQSSGKLLGQRKMVLILVTDESGDRAENVRYLEDTIALAKKADCRLYVLGREAAFNHRYVRVPGTDPKTKKPVSVEVDRGPETPRAEVLQTNMFTRRTDVRMSGFGSYEQARLARTTGGIFFMLPGAGGPRESPQARRNRLMQMRDYLPDLESRDDYVRALERSALRKAIVSIVIDMDGWNRDTARKIHLKQTYSIERAKQVDEMRSALSKAQSLIKGYDAAIQQLERLATARRSERSRRWQANYDLMLAELATYRARTYQYGVTLTQFNKKPPKLKDKKSNQWRVRTTKRQHDDPRAKELADEAKLLLQAVIQEHPGTPWAARARWELSRGLGIEIYEFYRAPRKPAPTKPKL